MHTHQVVHYKKKRTFIPWHHGCSFRNPVGAHGGERKTACQGAFIFISLTVGSVSWCCVEVVPVS